MKLLKHRKPCPTCAKRRREAIVRLNAAMMGLERAVNRRNVKRAMKACQDWLEHDPARGCMATDEETT